MQVRVRHGMQYNKKIKQQIICYHLECSMKLPVLWCVVRGAYDVRAQFTQGMPAIYIYRVVDGDMDVQLWIVFENMF